MWKSIIPHLLYFKVINNYYKETKVFDKIYYIKAFSERDKGRN